MPAAGRITSKYMMAPRRRGRNGTPLPGGALHAAVPSVPEEAPQGIEDTGSAWFNPLRTVLHVQAVIVSGFQRFGFARAPI